MAEKKACMDQLLPRLECYIKRKGKVWIDNYNALKYLVSTTNHKIFVKIFLAVCEIPQLITDDS